MKKLVLTTLFALASVIVSADIKVSDVEVFSGHPWKEVVIGYTITGTDANAKSIRLTATDKSANRSYTTTNLTGAVISEGRHIMRWNAASECAQFSSTNVVFDVSVMSYGGVQLWEDGPYWAECNVGATQPEEYGYYFMWGHTVGHKPNAANDGWISVKDGGASGFYGIVGDGKDNSWLQSHGYIDSMGNLVAAYDAATAHLGAPWRMPTDAEFSALISNCTTTWTKRNGVSGQLVTGKGAYATKSIFLPAAGYGTGSSLENPGSNGYYWSSTPYSNKSDFALHLYFDWHNFSQGVYYRFMGKSVRPLRGFVR